MPSRGRRPRWSADVNQEDLTLDEYDLLREFKTLHPTLAPSVTIEPWARGCYRVEFADDVARCAFSSWAQAWCRR